MLKVCPLKVICQHMEHKREIFYIKSLIFYIFAWNISPMLWQTKLNPQEDILIQTKYSLTEVILCKLYQCFFQSMCSLYYAYSIHRGCALPGLENGSSHVISHYHNNWWKWAFISFVHDWLKSIICTKTQCIQFNFAKFGIWSIKMMSCGV